MAPGYCEARGQQSVRVALFSFGTMDRVCSDYSHNAKSACFPKEMGHCWDLCFVLCGFSVFGFVACPRNARFPRVIMHLLKPSSSH